MRSSIGLVRADNDEPPLQTQQPQLHIEWTNSSSANRWHDQLKDLLKAGTFAVLTAVRRHVLIVISGWIHPAQSNLIRLLQDLVQI